MTSNLQGLLDQGVQLLRTNQVGKAHLLAYHLLEEHKGVPAVHMFAADVAALQGDLQTAITCLEDFLKACGDHVPVMLRKAELLFNDSQRSAALATVRAAAELVQPEERQLRTVARIMIDCQDLEGARTFLERALGMLPGNPGILYDLAQCCYFQNRVDDTEGHLAALLAIQPRHGSALHLRSTLRTQTEANNHIDELTALLETAAPEAGLERFICFALAKEYEDLGRYPEAFATLQRGSKVHRKTLRYDLASELASHQGIREAFTSEAFAGLEAGCDEEGPIFVVGMPRTGTTLVERLLSSHSAVASIGEFRDFPKLLTDMMLRHRAEDSSPGAAQSLRIDFPELGRRYLEAARQLVGDQPFFVDKLPFNFLYLGYIAAALPKARILHVSRDPLDTCYAVYKTLFFNAYGFSYDLDELAQYYISYRQQMRHWHELLPDRILDIGYEALVEDTEPVARRMLEWCGLPWEDTVLEFHSQEKPSMTASAMQVRRPVYTESIGSWQRAGDGFEAVKERLATAGMLKQG